MKPADLITQTLLTWCRSHASDIILPNFYLGRYEMDVMKITRTGYLVEYEVKVSRSDFFADFKKQHEVFDRWVPKGATYREARKKMGVLPLKTINKHQETQYGRRANRFFFVVPENLISIAECPPHAGLVYYLPNGRLLLARNAPLLHKGKEVVTMADIAHKMAFRELNLRDKIRRLTPQKARKKKGC
jgi:hypothetical protein